MDEGTINSAIQVFAVVVPIVAGAFGVKWQQGKQLIRNEQGKYQDMKGKASKFQDLIKTINEAVQDDKVTPAEEKAILKAIMALVKHDQVRNDYKEDNF